MFNDQGAHVNPECGSITIGHRFAGRDKHTKLQAQYTSIQQCCHLSILGLGSRDLVTSRSLANFKLK